MISKQYNNVSLTSKSTINSSWNIKKIEYLMLEPLNHPLFPLWVKYYFREQSILKLFSSDRILYFCNMRREIFCLSKLNIQNESAKAQKRCKSLKNCRITNSTAKKHKFALGEVKGVRGTILVFDSSFILFRSGTSALKLVKSAIAENAQ